ncbi:hypothetical protein BJ138DRAFT_1054630 [Hygrophoropsis aurantiaca]|uniref:Uncharacterized protein n=1 Tax=Hygrophoropsis aurantiaca TaxID=72124 RepID=A0ACB8APX9_9AGAM|nr:hypothetical protein BJ138DRAFT_1054630 [Hygrophoropsis aurantiaca]
MKFFASLAVLATVVASAFADTIELGYPVDGSGLLPGHNVTVQVVQPQPYEPCLQVGIALAVNGCIREVCPDPSQQMGAVLYSGPWEPVQQADGGIYQNFSVSIPMFLGGAGSGIFSLTHVCLIGTGPEPMIEYRNATVKFHN